VTGLDARLEELVRSSDWPMAALRAVRDVDPPDWLVGGGVLRDLVWDRLHGRADPGRPATGSAPGRRRPPRWRSACWTATSCGWSPPCGLEDLFALVCRRNPRRVSVDHYRRRLREKRIAERWPKVTIVDP
jgi:hypothetical protein